MKRKKPGPKPSGKVRRHVMFEADVFKGVVKAAATGGGKFSAVVNRALRLQLGIGGGREGEAVPSSTEA